MEKEMIDRFFARINGNYQWYGNSDEDECRPKHKCVNPV